MPGPKEYFKQDWRKRNPFGGEPIVDAACIFGSTFSNEDAGLVEMAQAIGEDICGYVFAGALKVAESAQSAHHHISNDEQGPAVAEEVEGDA